MSGQKHREAWFDDCSSVDCLFLNSACLKENWDLRKKKGDQAALAEDKKKKKKKGGKKGKAKSAEGEDGGDETREAEKASKKKKEKVKKKKKSKAPLERTDGGHSSEDEIQPKVPLSGQKTELWGLGWLWTLTQGCNCIKTGSSKFLLTLWIVVRSCQIFQMNQNDTWMHRQKCLLCLVSFHFSNHCFSH